MRNRGVAIAVKSAKRRGAERRGTMFEGRRKPIDLIVVVITLLAYGCPVQAIAQAFKLDERTVAEWRDRAGQHCQQVHKAIVEQEKLDLVHVQADELRVKGRKMVVWMGLAMMVSTRLWLAGTVSLSRDKELADALLQQVRRTAKLLRPLLVVTDGWAVYPGSIERAFREKAKTTPGPGRARLQVWSVLHIGTVIKRMEKKRMVEITRKMARGLLERIEHLLARSHGGAVLNTAFIERLNGTFRERLASLARKSRHAASRLQALQTDMYLIGCTYNFCLVHQELSKEKHWGNTCTPAMASGLTDHMWSFGELLSYKVAPAPWIMPKRRGRPPKRVEQSAKQQRASSRARLCSVCIRGSYARPPVSVALPLG